MPVTLEQHEKKLQDPAVCELLPVRDYLDGVMVRTNGALVAGYELRGINSYFASDGERDQNKGMLGALLKSIPEQSMTMQIRYEVVEDLGNLLGNYVAQDRLDQEAVCTLDATRLEAWARRPKAVTICGRCFISISSGIRKFIIALPAKAKNRGSISACRHFPRRPRFSVRGRSMNGSLPSSKACSPEWRRPCKRPTWGHAN
ncbi:MAG TPA: hypothetical protein VGJ33_00550 [Candidatus Angelobacter sp.]|jgi:hypothetical protein